MTVLEIEDPSTSDSVVMLSIQERDRRYLAIRERMRSENIDILILPPTTNRWEQSMADSRYVSGIGGFQTETLTVFPVEGDVTCYLFNRAPIWRAKQSWVSDVRDGRNDWGKNIVERLIELGFSSGTIGLSQLTGRSRTPDGAFPHGTYEKLRTSFPHAHFVSATDLMVGVRTIKSPEEIAALKQAALITDKMAEAALSTAKSGISEREVYASIVYAALCAGSEQPALLIYGSGPPVPRTGFVPSGRILSPGDLLIGELEARVAGYGAQLVAPMSIGEASHGYQEAAEVAAESFEKYLPELKSGADVLELRAKYQEIVQRVGKGNFIADAPSMHARGLGDEAPVLLRSDEFDRSETRMIAADMVFILKPTIRSKDGTISASIGRTVQITVDGALPLNEFDLSLAITG